MGVLPEMSLEGINLFGFSLTDEVGEGLSMQPEMLLERIIPIDSSVTGEVENGLTCILVCHLKDSV